MPESPLLVGLTLLATVALSLPLVRARLRRNERLNRATPARVPHGKTLLLRMLPFFAISLVPIIAGIVVGDSVFLVGGLVMLFLFVVIVIDRWRPRV